MGRTPAPVVAHRLNAAEQRVLGSVLAGRLPAGQVHTELERARVAAPVTVSTPAPGLQPAVAPAVAA